jgi:hypothetical protein
MNNLNNDKPNDTERQNKLNIYDNDDVYMLNDDKEDDISIEELKHNAAKVNYNQVKELSDDETVRKEQQEDEKERIKLLYRIISG